ncbi:Vacuolar protein-sorting-associated protein 11-like protein, partial [Drosera capensis]
MYQWRKFEFLEDKYAGKSKIGDEIEGQITCSSSGRGKVAIGSDDGTIGILDHGFKFSYGFRAHSSSVLHLQMLKVWGKLLIGSRVQVQLRVPCSLLVGSPSPVAQDEQIPGQASAMCLKIFDLDKTQTENTSIAIPECIQILRIFTNQFPEAKITSFLVLEEAPPQLLIAIGLDTGNIYCIEGDKAREKITRFKLRVNNASYKDNSAVRGMGFRVEGQAT